MSQDFKAELVALLPRLRRFARARTQTAEEADDLVQMTCERAWRARAQWEPGTRLDSWMFRIMVNLRIDLIRAAAAQGISEGGDMLENIADSSWGRQVEASVRLEQVSKAMHQLPEPMREILSLVTVEGLSYKEAAEVLQVPVGTVMSRLSRARTSLMQRLGMDPDAMEAAAV
jgi:RNA polymerase sigma-70 factor (ECF subfamily)